MLRIDPADSVPIWKQIEEGVRNLIASRALLANDPVPSVRELSRELRVNPLTVSKAYRQLADAGVLVVRRGDGTYVAPEPPSLSRAERRYKLREAALRYVSLAKTMGASADESLAIIEDAWKELDEERK
jgi:GntR family transcriptional regulator